MDRIELAFYIYSLFSGNVAVSGWTIGNILLGLGKLTFLNLYATVEQNHDKAVVVPAEIRNTDLSIPNQIKAFPFQVTCSVPPTADGEPK